MSKTHLDEKNASLLSFKLKLNKLENWINKID